MPVAVCEKCGADKAGPLETCQQCRAAVATDTDRLHAFALSTYCMSQLQLQILQDDIRHHRRYSIPGTVLAEAQRVVTAQLGQAGRARVGNGDKPPKSSPAAVATKLRADAPAATELERNPFAVLGASLRDNRAKLIELAESRALTGDEGEVVAARAAVTNPRTRLGAEIGWLPGTSPAKVAALINGLRKNPGLVRAASGLNPLTVANLTAAAMELIDPAMPADEWAGWLVALAQAEDEIDADDVLRDINEDRAVAGLPEVRDLALVEAALSERRRHYKDVTLAALEQVPSNVLVDALTTAVEEATSGGDLHAPLLIEEIASAYELRAAHAIEKGATGVSELVEAVRRSAPAGEASVATNVSRLERAVRSWDKLAQPVQLIMKSRGQEHEASKKLAYEVRSLGIELVNKHGFIEQGTRLTTILSEVFAELPEVVDRLESDAEVLENLREQRDESERQSAEWAREITYSAQIGAIFKDTLSISPAGVSWKSQSYPLDAVTRVRWGAVRQSVNGIPTGTTYTIAFGDDRSQAVCETRQEGVFDEFVPRLFRAVGVRIMIKMVSSLGAGQKLRIGDAVVDDDGVTVPRHAFFGSSKPVYLRWHELHVWSADGSFVIGSKTDKKAYAQMQYLHTDNLHLLERALRTFFKSKHGRLSQLFDE